MVKHVSRLPAELERYPLGNFGVLQDCPIEILEASKRERIAPQIALVAEQRLCKQEPARVGANYCRIGGEVDTPINAAIIRRPRNLRFITGNQCSCGTTRRHRVEAVDRTVQVCAHIAAADEQTVVDAPSRASKNVCLEPRLDGPSPGKRPTTKRFARESSAPSEERKFPQVRQDQTVTQVEFRVPPVQGQISRIGNSRRIVDQYVQHIRGVVDRMTICVCRMELQPVRYPLVQVNLQGVVDRTARAFYLCNCVGARIKPVVQGTTKRSLPCLLHKGSSECTCGRQ